jgi:hypothetical protein
MICPLCGSEYREGFTRCAECETDLVEPATNDVEIGDPPVKVYETGNAALIPLLESLLDSAGIEYLAKGEGIQDLFGWGRLGSNLNYVIGPVEFLVRADQADEARAIIETLPTEIAEEPSDEAE